MRRCKTCQINKPLTDFYAHKPSKDGRVGHCKECCKQRRQPVFDARTTLVRRLKDVPCTDCGHKFHFAAMDFDHIKGDKISNISKLMLVDEAKFLAEISKCEVVCSNCHRIRTYKRRTESQH